MTVFHFQAKMALMSTIGAVEDLVHAIFEFAEVNEVEYSEGNNLHIAPRNNVGNDLIPPLADVGYAISVTCQQRTSSA